jgi:hypothetical protein
VTWLLPELETGEEPELKPLEPELADEPEFAELEPEEELEPLEPLVPDEAEPDEPEPELAEDEPDEVEPEPDEEDVLVLCADPGRARASAPVATTLAMVTAVVADRTLDWPCSLAATARRILSRCALLMSPILRSRTRFWLYVTSRLPMKTEGPSPGPRGDGTQRT